MTKSIFGVDEVKRDKGLVDGQACRSLRDSLNKSAKR